MIVGWKDGIKLFGISVITCCAVLVCTMFLNFYLDITALNTELLGAEAKVFYQAQVATSKVVCYITGGCLAMTSVVTLLFYVRHYISTHKKELGILKALGYSARKISCHFWVFGLAVFAGAAVGFCGAWAIMTPFYAQQNKDAIFPELSMKFHGELIAYFIILPTVIFALLAIGCAFWGLRADAMRLMKEDFHPKKKEKPSRGKDEMPFLRQMKFIMPTKKKALAFFMTFAAFCFSAMTQMAFGMKDLSSAMMGVMMLIIGLVLSFTTLFLAVATVIRGNRKTVAVMKVFGYSQKECCNALLGGYRYLGYLGFAVGTVYQYVLLKVMVEVVFKDIGTVPEYKFDYVTMLISLAVFVVTYELTMFFSAERIKKMPVKEIMI